MAIINLKSREISCKIVYYGPSWGGKTTNIQSIHGTLPDDHRSSLQMINTEGDRTLFFEQFALRLGDCGGLSLRFMVYGVPGQPYYRNTRRAVLQGCDGIVFVADSDAVRLENNIESLQDMRQLLADHSLDPQTIPLVMQYNKRDLPDVTPVHELEERLNLRNVPSFEAVAVNGEGTQQTFKAICKQVVDRLQRDQLVGR